MLPEFRSWVHKLYWGMRVVGPWHTVEGLSRALAISVRRPPHAAIRLRSGPRLEFDFPSQFPVIPVIFGDLIDPEFAFLRAASNRDGVVVDVGAAIGQFSAFAATTLGASVHAFEPSTANIATLRRNLEHNGLAGRVAIHQVALSNRDGEGAFETTARTWVSRLTSELVPGAERVPVRTLAGELDRLGVTRASVLKINVAGFEPEVIEGALPFLAAGRVDVLILLLGLASLPWYETIAGYGYRFFYFHPKRCALYEVTAFDAGSVLDYRPWPARHIIAIHQSALAGGLTAGMSLQSLRKA